MSKQDIIDAYLDYVNGYMKTNDDVITVHPLGDFPLDYKSEEEMIADMIYTLEWMEENREW